MLPLYSSYFKLHVRWLRSLTRITYLSKLIGTPSLAAGMKLELFRVYIYRQNTDCFKILIISRKIISSRTVISSKKQVSGKQYGLSAQSRLAGFFSELLAKTSAPD
ncbi:hypothetical protein DMB41_08450 [Pectobacterium carotovorum subsp. carotovorum]|nr:hypothetical protein DMB41_08450 [Pectobacterium carotovorum subsp. carotovorum]